MASRMEDWIDKLDEPVDEFDRDLTELRRSMDVFDRQLRLVTVNMTRFSRAVQTSATLATTGHFRTGQAGTAMDNRQFSTSLTGLGTAIAANTAATSAQAAAIAANTATLRSLSLFAGASAASRVTTGLVGTAGVPMAPGAGGLYPRSSRPVPPVPLRPIDDGDDSPQLVRRNEAEMQRSETPEQTQKRHARNARQREKAKEKRDRDLKETYDKEHDFSIDPIMGDGVRNVPIVIPGFNAQTPRDPSMGMWSAATKGMKPKLRLPPPGNLLPTGMGETATSPEIQALEKEMADAEEKYARDETARKIKREAEVEKRLGDEKDPAARAAAHKKSADAAKSQANKRAAAQQALIDGLKAQIAQLRQKVQQTAVGKSTQITSTPGTGSAPLANTTTPVPGLPTGTLPPIPIPGGLPPIPKQPPTPPWFPLFPPGPPVPPGGGGGRGGGGRGRGGSGGGGQGPGFGQLFQGSISLLVLALKENTLATRLNTMTMNRQRIDMLKGGGPQPPQLPGTDNDPERRWTGLSATMNAIASATATASAAMLGFSALADPSTFSTFTGSVKLLGAAIGDIFAPVVKEAAFYIQGWRDAIKDLEPETKSNIATIGKWVLGIGLLVTALRAVGAATGATNIAIGAFNLLWKVSPLGAVITSLATVAGLAYTAAEAFGVFGKKATDSSRNAANAVNQINPQGPNAPVPAERNLAQIQQDLPVDIQDKLNAAKNKKQREEILAAEKARLDKEMKGAKEDLPEDLKEQQKKRDFIEVEARLFQSYYKEQLAAFNKRTGRNYDYIPDQEQEYQNVIDESIKVRRNVTREGTAIGMKFTPEDMAPLMPQSRLIPNWLGGNRNFTDWGIGAPPKLPAAPNQTTPGEKKISGIQKAIDNVEAFAKAIGGQKDKIEDIVLPGGVQARYTDAVSYRESVQLAGLNKVDTQTELLQDQLATLARNEKLLTEIKDYQSIVANALRNARPVVGK